MHSLSHAFAELDAPAAAYPESERRTGLPTLDDLIGAPRRGDLWVVTGAPGQGTTTLLTQLACELALHGVAPWAVRLHVPRETPGEVAARLVSLVGDVPRGRLLQGSLDDETHRRRTAAARGLLTDAPLRLGAGRVHALPSCEQVRDLAELSGLPVALLVDDADLRGPGVVAELRELAGAGVLVIATVARDAVVDGPGEDADLREEWARWADLVLEVRTRGVPPSHVAVPEDAQGRLRVLRHRRGPTRDVPVHFEPAKNRFREPGTRMPSRVLTA